MALQKNIVTNYGVDATYWKICITNFDWYKNIAVIDIKGFVDETARQEDKEPLATISYNFSGEDFTFNSAEDVIAHAYNKLKALPDWDSAEDI